MIYRQTITFPPYASLRCLMMPYIQGDSASVPKSYGAYKSILDSLFITKGDLGFLTIDESPVTTGAAHRGQRAKFGRALHTEVGRVPGQIYCWGGGGGGWGQPSPSSTTPKPKPKPKPKHRVTLDRDVRILIANNLDDSCAVWDAEHEKTSSDGDIGYAATDYPYDRATFLKAGDVYEIGILTPHESLPVRLDFNRQFLRIVSSGVHGREPYFTQNPLMGL